MTLSDFVARFGGVYEHSAWVAESAFDRGLPPDADTTRNLKLIIEVNYSLRDQVRLDSRAKIKTQGLLGDKVYDISVGTPRYRTLREGDTLWLPEIYYAGGTVTRDLSSAELAADIGAAYAQDHAAVVRWVASEARPGTTVLLMGARDPELPRLARSVLAALD